MSRTIRMLVAATAAGGLALTGLLTLAGAASAATAGTTGPGSWFFDQGDGNNAIVTTGGGTPSTKYQAQIQQPINADASSVWPAKKGVIPVQFQLQQATCTPGSSTLYPDTLTSLQGVSYPGLGSYGNLSWTPPSGSGLTVGQITNLTANFTWLQGQNHTGSMYWIINTPDGNVWIYYGDIAGTGVYTGTSGTGANMINLALGSARAEASQLGHSPQYDTLANILAAAPASGSVPTIGQEPVNWIGLAVDEGSAGTQQVQLTSTSPAVDIGTAAGDSTYTPGTVSSSPSCTAWTNTTTPSMYIDIAQGSSADPGTVDETSYTGVGDTSGQFAVVDGKYKYNLSNSLAAGTYNIWMTPDTDADRIPVTNSPTGSARFVLK